MKLTTLCYIEENNKYLMLHRTKKEHDENAGKWIGVGGKFEEGESPEDCIIREVLEETGLTINNPTFRGIVTFVSNEFGTEYMHLFTASDYKGSIINCNEGELEWVSKDKVMNLNLWEGDRIFLDLLTKDTPFFSLKLCYQADTLVDSVLNIY